MNARRALLGLFVVLALALASVALYESTGRTGTLNMITTLTGSTASSLGSSVCPPPGPPPQNPLGGGGSLGPPPLTFVGGNATCIEVTPSAAGSNSTADFAFTLDATKHLFVTMYIDDNANGTSTLPSGTRFTATMGSERFPVYQTLQPQGGVQGPQLQTVLTIPAGNTTVHFQAFVPNPYQPGTYRFAVLVTAWSSSSRTGSSYADEFRANLVAV